MNTVITNLPVPAQATPHIPFSDLERMAQALAKSRLFSIQTPEQAIALMLIAQAEGRHPATVARDYDIIQGRAAKKTEAMLRDLLQAGGSVEWHELTDALADATFTHPQGGKVRISWDMKRAETAQLKGKDNYRKFPRQMLRSRCVSEGIRTVCPAATSGMHVPEEVADFDDRGAALPVTVQTTMPLRQAPRNSDFAPSPDPLLNSQVPPSDKKPWEKKTASPKAKVEDTVPPAEIVRESEHPLASFEIPGGPHKGVKLKDKPDAFWETYAAELLTNLPNVPKDRQQSAQDTIEAIKEYLAR